MCFILTLGYYLSLLEIKPHIGTFICADNEVKSGPQTKWNLMEPLLGVEMWIWIAVGAASLLLIGLVVVIVLVYRRNKRIKVI